MDNAFWSKKTSCKIVDLVDDVGLEFDGKDIDRINRWYRELRKRTGFDATYVRFYHGTDPNLSIEDEGLKPGSSTRKRNLQSESGFVCLSTSPDAARIFGELGNSGRCVVYEVLVPVHRMLPDLDQLVNKRASNPDALIGLSLGDSIIHSGGIRVRGSIEPWAIAQFEAHEYYHRFEMFP